jgi:RNA polymerase sigma-70 factor (ECF subfamily)
MWDKKSRFTVLVEALSPDLYRYAYWLAGDKHIAEDLVQETFTRAWRSLDALRDERAAKAWLITTLRRENARRFARKSLDRVDLDVDTLEARNANDYGPEARALGHALRDLSADYREPLLLQIIGGFSVQEIAQEMSLTPGAVTTRLFRARQKLRAVLSDDDELEVSN